MGAIKIVLPELRLPEQEEELRQVDPDEGVTVHKRMTYTHLNLPSVEREHGIGKSAGRKETLRYAGRDK